MANNSIDANNRRHHQKLATELAMMESAKLPEPALRKTQQPAAQSENVGMRAIARYEQNRAQRYRLNMEGVSKHRPT